MCSAQAPLVYVRYKRPAGSSGGLVTENGVTRGQPRVVIIITYSGFKDRVWCTYQPVVFPC